MRIEVTIIPNLSEQIKEYIYWYMSFPEGAMRQWIDLNDDEVYVGLLFEDSHNKELPIAWAAITGHQDPGYVLGAWTDEDFREKGFSTKIIKALLKHHNIKKDVIIEVFDERMSKILDKLGYTSYDTWWSIART